MKNFYGIVYAIGFKPWEGMQRFAGEQVAELFDEVETGRTAPFGAALDLGCGTGIWSVVLAQRGWDVTGVDMIPKAVRGARARAQRAGVKAKFVRGTVTDIAAAGVGDGFRLVLDFGTLHGLKPAEFTEAARGVTAVSTEGASLLMLASSPGGRGPLPRGVDRDEVARAFAAGRSSTTGHSRRKESPSRSRRPGRGGTDFVVSEIGASRCRDFPTYGRAMVSGSRAGTPYNNRGCN